MPYDVVALRLVRTHTNAPLRDCVDALARVDGDPVQAISQIHAQQARTLATQTGASIAQCLHAVQLTLGDLDQAQRVLTVIDLRVRGALPPELPVGNLIYVAVEGSVPNPDWYPVEAEQVHDQCYRILSENPDPEHLYWQFETGDVVCCILHTFAEHEVGLIATARCDHRADLSASEPG